MTAMKMRNSASCIKEEKTLELSGIDSSTDQTVLAVSLSRCDQALLEVGQECMTEKELEEYYLGVELYVAYFDTKIDFEDIETPLKTAFKSSRIAVDQSNPIGVTVEMKQHKFKD